MKRMYQFLRAIYRWTWRAAVELFRLVGRHTLRIGGPLGFYRLLDKTGATSLVLPRQETRPAGPESLRVKCGFLQDSRQPWPIFWTKISPARLVGRSLAVLDDNKKLMSEAVYGEVTGAADPSFNYFTLPPATHLSGSWTSIISRWCPATSSKYYHWLMDALPRLAIIDRFPSDTRILTAASLNAFQRDSLEILGLLDRCRPTPETHLVLEDYYYSSFTTMTGCDNPYAIQFLRNKFLAAATPNASRPDKIYISRLDSLRGPQEEEKIIAILQDQGWTIVKTQKYSFREQIALFAEARAVCAVHGAGLTNLLWCQPGCKVLELCPANYLNGCFEGLAAFLDLDYRYMVFDADFKYHMKIDLGRFSDAIQGIERELATR